MLMTGCNGKGTVKNEDGELIPNAYIAVRTSQELFAIRKGTFKLPVPFNETVVDVFALNYQSDSLKLNVYQEYNIILKRKRNE